MPGGKYRDPRKQIDPPAPEPYIQHRSVKEIVQHALKLKFWIFDPSSKEWYSSEEFQDKFERITSGNQKVLDGCEIRDPFEGIKAGFLRTHDMQVKLEDFINRVVDYYRK